MHRYALASGLYLTAAIVWVFLALIVTAQPAFAYVDPGAGLFAFQVLGSTFLGFTFLARNRIRSFFGRMTGASRKERKNDRLR